MSNLVFNITYQPSSKWIDKLRCAALEFGDRIVDIPFPDVPAMGSLEDIESVAMRVSDIVEDNLGCDIGIGAFIVQGESTLVYALVHRLRVDYHPNNIPVLAPCFTPQIMEEFTEPDGKIARTIGFVFEQFREYPRY